MIVGCVIGLCVSYKDASVFCISKVWGESLEGGSADQWNPHDVMWGAEVPLPHNTPLSPKGLGAWARRVRMGHVSMVDDAMSHSG